MRDAVRKSKMTRVERDITIALVNLWFHHKAGPEGCIRPGREKIAKRVGCSVKSVTRCLSMLKASGSIRAIAYEKGGTKATRYKVSLYNLLILCGADLPEWMGENVPLSGSKMSRFTGDKMSHGIYTVQACPSQSGKQGEVF